jgi:hypothetical protein
MEMGNLRNTTSKPPKIAHMMSKENEDLKTRLSQLKNEVEEMSGSMLKLEDYSCSQEILKREMDDNMVILMNNRIGQMEKKMNENKD